MATEYRPDVLGAADADEKKVDPIEAIQKMETELQELAGSLREIRHDYVKGLITDEEFEKVESKFSKKLEEQRNVLQLLRSAAGEK